MILEEVSFAVIVRGGDGGREGGGEGGPPFNRKSLFVLLSKEFTVNIDINHIYCYICLCRVLHVLFFYVLYCMQIRQQDKKYSTYGVK